MRVISGTAGGRRLETPRGMAVRPTTEKVKEALFSSIQFELEGKKVLDLFAGSGQLGIEALSRGAESAVFVDNSSDSLEIVKNNLKKCGFSADVLKCDGTAYIYSVQEKFDFIFLDPPYGTGLLLKALEGAAEKISPGGVITAEHPLEEELPDTIGNCFVSRRKKYGKLQLTFYRRREL